MDGPSTEAEFALINELLQAIDEHPPAIEARKLLADQYELFGWQDEAAAHWNVILQLCPDDRDAKFRLGASYTPRTSIFKAKRASSVRSSGAAFVLDGNVNVLQLEAEYKSLMTEAQDLVQDLQIYQDMCQGLDFTGQIADLKAIASGRSTAVLKVKTPPGARAVAATLKTCSKPEETVFADLDSYARWIRTQNSNYGLDDVRDATRKRAQAIKEALSPGLAHTAEMAFMHVEHEVLAKTYQNEGGTTMLGDSIPNIPRSNFWVSEDGYAWDMEELAGALKANKGVMRNPLSKQMFTAADVKAIVRHPLGKGLAALQVKQQQLTNGIRRETIDQLEKLAAVLLEDQSADAGQSRIAVDEFLSFTATLPDEEQMALQELRVPAKDSHTGKAFDGSIGEAVDDAKANKQCFHKTGDLLNQAAGYLRTKARGKGRIPGAWK